MSDQTFPRDSDEHKKGGAKPMGFAKMAEEDPERQHEIASKGGHARGHGGGHGGGERGFAKMAKEDPERQREIAAKGGRASGGRSHEEEEEL